MEDSSSAPDNLRRQLRQHLDSLRAAGVEWLPTAPPVSSLPSPPKGEGLAEPPGSFDQLPDSGLSIEQRKHELTVLATQVAGCTRCPELAATRTQTVFGVGEPSVEVCFMGEAPGADEDRQGEPFVGAAGQLLNRIITACGMKREEVYICNILRCRPPGNRLPLPHEAANCRGWLEHQLELVRPTFIVALGTCAAQNLLGSTLSIGKLRGRFHDYRGIPVLCTFHPAYLLRSPEHKRDVWDDMKLLLARMGRPVPGQKPG